MLTVHGPDRLGIVATIAETLAARGANVREMTCAREAGAHPTYAVTMEVEVPASVAADLERELRRAAESLRLRLSLEPIEQHVL